MIDYPAYMLPLEWRVDPPICQYCITCWKGNEAWIMLNEYARSISRISEDDNGSSATENS